MNFADMGEVLVVGMALLDLVQLDDAAGFFLLRHIVGKLALGDGLGPLGIFEDVSGIEFHRFHHLHRFFELGFRFGGEADDDVGAQHHGRVEGTDLIDQVEKFFPGVGAVHHLQHPVVAGLQGEVNLLAHFRIFRDHLQQAAGEIFRMGRGEADALDAFHCAHLFEKIGKIMPFIAIGIDILSQQGDLAETLSGQAFHLIDHVLRRTAAFPAPGVGHHAEGAEIVATAHHRQPGIDAAILGGVDVGIGLELR